MKGVGVLRGPLQSDAPGARASYIIAVVGCYPWMKMGTRVEIFSVQHVTKKLIQHYCACLSPNMMRIAVKKEGVMLPVMSVTTINVAVAVDRMHQTVGTTVCTA
jgi:hypothetical protein